MNQTENTSQPAGSKTRYFVGGVVVLACVLGLVIVTKSMGFDFYSSISDFSAQVEAYDGRPVKIRGIIKADAVNHDPKTLDTDFILTDGEASVRVFYHGVLDSSFEPGKDLVVQGVYDLEKQTLMANKLMFKCPSKYEAKEGTY